MMRQKLVLTWVATSQGGRDPIHFLTVQALIVKRLSL